MRLSVHILFCSRLLSESDLTILELNKSMWHQHCMNRQSFSLCFLSRNLINVFYSRLFRTNYIRGLYFVPFHSNVSHWEIRFSHVSGKELILHSGRILFILYWLFWNDYDYRHKKKRHLTLYLQYPQTALHVLCPSEKQLTIEAH